MRLKEKKLLQKFAATLKKFSAQGAKKVEYGILEVNDRTSSLFNSFPHLKGKHKLKWASSLPHIQSLSNSKLLHISQDVALYALN